MPIYKNQETGTWYVICWYTHWTGERKQKCKRGFPTKKAASEWERQFLMQKQANIDMSFEAFYELYKKDIQPKLKENTWLTKLYRGIRCKKATSGKPKPITRNMVVTVRGSSAEVCFI